MLKAGEGVRFILCFEWTQKEVSVSSIPYTSLGENTKKAKEYLHSTLEGYMSQGHVIKKQRDCQLLS